MESDLGNIDIYNKEQILISPSLRNQTATQIWVKIPSLNLAVAETLKNYFVTVTRIYDPGFLWVGSIHHVQIRNNTRYCKWEAAKGFEERTSKVKPQDLQCKEVYQNRHSNGFD